VVPLLEERVGIAHVSGRIIYPADLLPLNSGPYALLLAFTAILEGHSPFEFREKWININKNGLLVWPIANIINFRFQSYNT
jgi:hypothetical protein